ncbi:MAG: molecular chaperone HtpG [Candidatus Eutrophobiaceae bacterium]
MTQEDAAAGSETMDFQAEIKQLLDLMAHSLYGNREVFLRELISNASDAADRLRFEALSDGELYEKDSDLHIRVEFDKEAKTITVQDNGIGMSRSEIIDSLGTIARSGTKEFFSQLTGEQGRDSQLIGQFGVGFYSAFIVAEKVEVVSRRAGALRKEGVRWSSTSANGFTVEDIDRPRRGTKVVLHLREGMEEFLDGYQLRSLIRKYSDHISIPIIMVAESSGEQDEIGAGGDETVNNTQALWRRNKKDIGEDEYKEFYKKHVGHDLEEPMAWVHSQVEGKLEYNSLLFIPKRPPFDLWDRERRHGVKLYVRRIFIMDDAEKLLPSWLRFVKGVVDCDDLPLNVSREILQQNKSISAINSGCTQKILGLLKDLAAKDSDRYGEFWDCFGKVLKEGVVELGNQRQDELLELFRFASTHGGDEGEVGEQRVALADYLGRMGDDAEQSAIYYITAESHAAAQNSPHLEVFNAKGIEVLLLSDSIDEWLIAHVSEYQGKPLRSVSKGELSLGAGNSAEEGQKADDADSAEKRAAAAPEQEKLLARFKQALGEQVRDVRASSRLTESLACLVAEEHEMSRHLERMLEAAGQKPERQKPILEINVEHDLVQRMAGQGDEELFAEWAHVLLSQALLSEGGTLDDPAGFVKRLNRLLFSLGS